jgi:hypothetical protein
MLTRDEVGDLIQLHAAAYRLLMWLDRQAGENPKVLAPEVVALLAKPASCGPWLEENRSKLPLEVLPEGPMREEFVNLFSSFFSTSFHVKHVSFGEELLESHLSAGGSMYTNKLQSHKEAQALALKHLASSEGIRLFEADAHKLAKLKSMKPHLLLWTYVWELGRRAKGKGKGQVVHQIWRDLPLATRKNLSTEIVWKAREEIVGMLRSAELDL